MARPSPREGGVRALARPTRWVCGGLVACAGLVAAVGLRYGRGPDAGRHALYLAAAMAVIFACAVAAVLLDAWGRRGAAPAGPPPGVRAGIAGGLIWAAEIGFNNLADPRVSIWSTRVWVDNGAWALVAILIVVAATRAMLGSGLWSAAARAGLWAGLVSGLIACLSGLILTVFGIRFLLRDPINIQEYRDRVGAGSVLAREAYFAFDTLAGALGHLTVLGLGMGLVLAGVGGAAGRVLRPR